MKPRFEIESLNRSPLQRWTVGLRCDRGLSAKGASFHLVGADQLGERVGAFFGQWQVTDLVNNQQRCTEIVAQFGAHLPVGCDGRVPAN